MSGEFNSALFEQSKCSDTPLRVRSALLLASKYLMADLRANLIRVVEREWPHSVEDLDERDANLEDYMYNYMGLDDAIPCNVWPIKFLPEPASAIALAEEFGISSIMPAAYYDILRCSPSYDWDEESSVSMSPFATRKFRKPARWGCLGPNSLMKMFRLEELLESDELMLGLVWYYDVKECEVADEICLESWREVTDDAMSGEGGRSSRPVPSPQEISQGPQGQKDVQEAS